MRTESDLNKYRHALKEKLPYMREQYGVESLGVFGSYVRQDQDSESDLDVLVTFSDSPGFLKFVELENYLSEELGVNVDLVVRDALRPRIADHILEEVVPV